MCASRNKKGCECRATKEAGDAAQINNPCFFKKNMTTQDGILQNVLATVRIFCRKLERIPVSPRPNAGASISAHLVRSPFGRVSTRGAGGALPNILPNIL
jgi:hypothetical protein